MTLMLDIKVSPCSGRQQWVLGNDKTIKCFLKSAPEKGKANRELIELLQKSLSISNKDVEIVGGLTSRRKKVIIRRDISFEQVLMRLGVERQKLLF